MAKFTRTVWIISNQTSGGVDDAKITALISQLSVHGRDVSRHIDLSDGVLPDAGEWHRDRPEFIMCLGGDGTVVAAIDVYGAITDARFLVLPGGTMNLISRKLHGDATIDDILAKTFGSSDPTVVQLPCIEGPSLRSMVGVIAGSTTIWGDVREHLRRGEVVELVEIIPDLLGGRRDVSPLRIEGMEEAYAALFIDAAETTLTAHAISADSLGDLARHGIAWLSRDFLGGPTQEIARANEFTLHSEDGDIDLLVDGERSAAPSPLTLNFGICPAHFCSTREWD